MKIIENELEGVFEIKLEPKEDNRGFFMRVYDEKIFKNHGLHREWVQENHSLSLKKGTVRGFHFQYPPHAETKLVRVISGAVFDVFLDLRKGSKTFGRWESRILSEENKKMLYIPRGFAHGMCTLADNTVMLYKVDNFYAPDHEGCIRWDDSELKIEWPLEEEPVLSKKDKNAPSFKEFIDKKGGVEL